MTPDELNQAIALMRTIGKDTQHFEVKRSRKALPKDVVETISAFSNGSGGVIICGLSEQEGFVPVKGFDPAAIHDALAQACSQKVTPPVRPTISIMPFEGSKVVVAEIREMRSVDKPCYVTASGKYHGSYIRTGDGDQRLSEYEVDRLLDEHQQPRFDGRIVPEATMADLDSVLVRGLLRKERADHPRNFARVDDTEALQLLNVVKRDAEGVARPTLAGLLALGSYPQQYFPRLNVSFAVYPGVDKSEVAAGGMRLLDSTSVVGPIPYLVADAVAAVRRNMRVGSSIEGPYRKDAPDYPPIALREAIANALMHRDYSPLSQGTPVHVDMFADRIEITNPGGLYGTMTLELLGKEHGSSTRNQFLATILESTPAEDGGYVVENRGTGFQAIERELAAASMPAPVPKNSISFFTLALQRRRVAGASTKASSGQVTREVVLALIAERGEVGSTEVAQRTGLSRSTVVKHINRMIAEGVLEPTEPCSTSRNRRYRLASS